jgi:aldehyde dehydrogenase (NAD+)
LFSVHEDPVNWRTPTLAKIIRMGDNTLRLIFYEPFGVCAGIIAWNGVQHALAMKVAPAVAAGCTFILKSSEKSPFGALKLGELIKKAGFPPGVINIVSGPGSTGQLLSEHMGISKISFTGSTFAGRQVQLAAAKSNLKVSPSLFTSTSTTFVHHAISVVSE